MTKMAITVKRAVDCCLCDFVHHCGPNSMQASNTEEVTKRAREGMALRGYQKVKRFYEDTHNPCMPELLQLTHFTFPFSFQVSSVKLHNIPLHTDLQTMGKMQQQPDRYVVKVSR